MKLPHSVLAAQDRLAAVLGCDPARRPQLLALMLHRGPAEVTGYWAQLLIAAGIATLGLVLGSTAVIIGAMLVAPLMGPIVGLGMGLAAGSTVLVIRSSVRVLASLIAVAAISALLTRLLPFHQLNEEIAARTTPTALDLGIAVFCAMAGVFATLRPASDVATTAAGTSIGISLVPPLCVSGYGIGTLAWPVAQGAALLFLTNFAAIVLVASVAFAAVGFGQAEIAALEAAELDATPEALLARPLVRRITRSIRGRGPWLRLLMPFVLLAALYSPLRRGLDEVAWQITARGNVDSAIGSLESRVVQAQVKVERRQIQIVIFLLGTQAEALAARERLVREISASASVTPIVEVFAVPNSTEFEALERATQLPAVPIVAPPVAPVEVAPPPLAELVDDVAQRVSAAVEARWPPAAGRIVQLEIDTETNRAITLRLVHLGRRLDEATVETLVDILSEDLGATVWLRADELPGSPLELGSLDAQLLARVATYVERGHAAAELTLCFRASEAPKARRDPSLAARIEALDALVASYPRVTRIAAGDAVLWFTAGDCEAPPRPAQ